MKRWLLILSIVVVFLALAGGVFFFTHPSNNQANLRTVTVESRTITQDVTFSGRLAPDTVSDVSFELPGTVTALLVAEGETVSAHQPLAVLDTSSVALELAQAHAATVSTQEKTKLAWEATTTARKNTAAVNAATIAQKRQAVVDAKRELDQAKNVHQQRAQESGDIAAATESAIAALRAAESAWHTTQQALAASVASAAQSNAAAQATETSARADYLATTQTAGNVAGLSSLEAQESLVANKSNKHTLTAPFAGTVITQHKTLGEAALAGQTVVTIATVDRLELTATATETDAIKLKLGLPASITFDALPTTQQWTGQITFISPAATVLDGIPTYTVKLSLTEPLTALRPGLTANITVHAAAVTNVLGVPRRAIILRENKEFVSVKQPDETIAEKPVVTGLIGSDGTVEIQQGLSTGDQVIVNPGEIAGNNDDANN